jgi:hypothetical protein
MRDQVDELARQYFSGAFEYENIPNAVREQVGKSDFYARTANFKNYDDWYRGHYAQYGARVDSVIAMVRIAITAFKETHGHMPLCYKNCAISSGTNPHLDAVLNDHYTSDKLARVIGSERHTWQNIVDNSLRSLARAQKIHPLYPEMYLVTPSAFEGSTRVFSKGSGHKLTGGLPFDGADYMSFWNMVIDSCEGFILDDLQADTPELSQVMHEIELAQIGSKEARTRHPIQTSDWANSRNSILEMARGNYIRFGLHPLRPDAKMDMRIYDEETHNLYPATLLACFKPVLQNILRWTPQGIATEEACRTAARIMHIHRMRTDPDYNSRQPMPIELAMLDPLIGNPSENEKEEFQRLINYFEPFLLRYCAHLIRTDGLPDQYFQAQRDATIEPSEIKTKALEWQRQNIPLVEIEKLWPMTIATSFDPNSRFEKRSALHGQYQPLRRIHDFHASPFSQTDTSEIWPDSPFEDLDEMSQDMARFVIGVLETGLLPLDSPDFKCVRFDMKRGEPALKLAAEFNVRDMNLLPGIVGSQFRKQVGDPNLRRADKLIEQARKYTLPDGNQVSGAAFGTPQVKIINDTIRKLRPNLAGPGPAAPSSDFRLALEMEMMRRNCTHIQFQNGWESSPDSSRMMLQATKIQMAKVKRPGDNHTELAILNEKGDAISFYERFETLRLHLASFSKNPEIEKNIETKNAKSLQDLGLRHTSLALARMIEIYDCLIDPLFNNGRFELQWVEDQRGFSKDIHKIQSTKEQAKQDILQNWVWLWSDKDLHGLRRDYEDAWRTAHGLEAQWARPEPTDDEAISHRYNMS